MSKRESQIYSLYYFTIQTQRSVIISKIGVCCPDNIKTSLPQQGHVWGTNDYVMGKESNDANRIRPEERGCGLSTKSYSKITGGRPADPSEWPWMAAVLRRGIQHAFCGGALITNLHVLTAAHCIYRYDKNELTVRLGEYDQKVKNETRSRDFRILEIRQHIDFDETTYDNDIAILKLHQSVLFNSYIWPVCLPPTGENFAGWNGIVTGWGSQFFGGPSSSVLMEVTVPIWKQQDCQNVFIERIGENVLCAGSVEGGRDSCQVWSFFLHII